jgi:hypothetical protein
MDVEVDNLGNACDGYQVTVTNVGAVPTTVPPVTVRDVLLVVVLVFGVSGALGAPAAGWFRVASLSRPGNLQPGDSGFIVATAVNVGGAAVDGNALGEKEPIVLSDVVPAGLKAVGISEVDGPDRK